MRVFSFAILVTLIGLASGCTHKPAYSNINTDRPRAAENSNASETPAPPPASVPPASVPPTPAPSSSNSTDTGQAAANPQTSQARVPGFLDRATGGAKDLPNYPNGRRLNVTYGPVGDTDTMSLILRTRD